MFHIVRASRPSYAPIKTPAALIKPSVLPRPELEFQELVTGAEVNSVRFGRGGGGGSGHRTDLSED